MIFAALGTLLWVSAGIASPGDLGALDSQAKPVAKAASAAPGGSPGVVVPQAKNTKRAVKEKASKPAPPSPAKRVRSKATVPVPKEKANLKKAKKPAPEAREITTMSFAGKRDPFKPLSVAGPSGPPINGQEITGPLPPGLRGLVIGQLGLEGIVRQDTTNTMIAVVANESKRAYFLRENDSLYNGVVSKITPEAIYFKENFIGQSGQVSSREIVKRMAPAAGEVK